MSCLSWKTICKLFHILNSSYKHEIYAFKYEKFLPYSPRNKFIIQLENLNHQTVTLCIFNLPQDFSLDCKNSVVKETLGNTNKIAYSDTGQTYLFFI